MVLTITNWLYGVCSNQTHTLINITDQTMTVRKAALSKGKHSSTELPRGETCFVTRLNRKERTGRVK